MPFYVSNLLYNFEKNDQFIISFLNKIYARESDETRFFYERIIIIINANLSLWSKLNLAFSNRRSSIYARIDDERASNGARHRLKQSTPPHVLL